MRVGDGERGGREEASQRDAAQAPPDDGGAPLAMRGCGRARDRRRAVRAARRGRERERPARAEQDHGRDAREGMTTRTRVFDA